VYKTVDDRVKRALTHHIRERYKTDVPVVAERPPKLEMGEIASPVCFELAKRLKRSPRSLAQEIANSLARIEGVARVEVAGTGYLNLFLDRSAFFRGALVEAESQTVDRAKPDRAKVIVEHTSINPNKAAHIGHLRNAVLGDSFARLLRHAGCRVEVENYIDNTGVQVADVVLGFLQVEPRTPGEVRALADEPKFDYLCWDLYATVTQWLAEDPSRLALRARTLQQIEQGHGEAATMAEVVSTAIVRCHLRTLDRLGIRYDLLLRESDILHLKFWDAAFEMLKQRGAIEYAQSGKNAGCWVMQLPSETEFSEESQTALPQEPSDSADVKIIVRSNGTVTYVGKDIAYHLWKFGLLGRDFHYRRFSNETRGPEPWATTSEAGDLNPPSFGQAHDVYNVIDARQAYPQQVVVAGLRALGYTSQAERLRHFSYSVVALTPRCAEDLGYEIPLEEKRKPYIEVSGRKGQGVKADDLIDRLELAAKAEIEARHPELAGTTEYHEMVQAIAIGALRYFLLRFTRSTVIAFDFKDALSFEGETGPYVQYAVVRVNGIVRKGIDRLGDEDARALKAIESGSIDTERFLTGAQNNDVWELVLLAASLDERVDAAVAVQEPAFVARYAFELAQAFNVFYHKHHILSEEDIDKRAFLLRLSQLVKDQLVGALALLGIQAPERM
jgi:arginyl-tRNA synthetase